MECQFVAVVAVGDSWPPADAGGTDLSRPDAIGIAQLASLDDQPLVGIGAKRLAGQYHLRQRVGGGLAGTTIRNVEGVEGSISCPEYLLEPFNLFSLSKKNQNFDFPSIRIRSGPALRSSFSTGFPY